MPSSYCRMVEDLPLGWLLRAVVAFASNAHLDKLSQRFLHTAPSHTPKVLLTVCRRVQDW